MRQLMLLVVVHDVLSCNVFLGFVSMFYVRTPL